MKYDPIFPDKPAHPSSFDVFPEDTLFVRNIFLTIQGEGPFAGRVAVFVRLGGCNFGGKGTALGPGCRFCDTDFRVSESRSYPFSEIASLVWSWWNKSGVDKEHDSVFKEPGFSMRQPGKPLVVITGGEPMLQANLAPFTMLAGQQFRIQIESNGSRLLPISKYVTLVVSPKVLETEQGHGVYLPLSKEVLQRADCLKILISADPTSPYHNLPGFCQEFLHGGRFGRDIWLSPIVVHKGPPKAVSSIWDSDEIDQEATARNHAYAAELAIKYNYRVSLQTHLFLNVP